jgi:stage V sporulation protein D (sporulation-specific penicillin-binding protein)
MLLGSLDSKKRILFILIIVSIILIIILIRVTIIQLIEGDEWRKKSETQQYVSRSITANRGTIYDSSGEIILAQSSTVETVTVNPVNISSENKEKVAKVLSEIFELDYEKVLKKVNKNSSIETIIKR